MGKSKFFGFNPLHCVSTYLGRCERLVAIIVWPGSKALVGSTYRKLAMAEAGLIAAIAPRCTPEPYIMITMVASMLLIAIPTIPIVR